MEWPLVASGEDPDSFLEVTAASCFPGHQLPGQGSVVPKMSPLAAPPGSSACTQQPSPVGFPGVGPPWAPQPEQAPEARGWTVASPADPSGSIALLRQCPLPRIDFTHHTA